MSSSVLTKISGTITSRRGARGTVIAFLLLITLAFGLLSGIPGATHSPTPLPPNSQSAQVSKLLEGFEGSGKATALLVASRPDQSALTPADRATLDAAVAALAPVSGQLQIGKPLLSEDSKAGLVTLSWPSHDPLADRDQLAQLRQSLADQKISGLSLQLTGGAAFGLDVAQSFDGADFTLLAVTIAVVALLLIFTYRSPILWLIPLVVVAIADRAASLVTGALAQSWQLHFDTGVLSVLVFGAGTNYALLLISRYRDELRQSADHRAAMARAWRASFTAILSSNLTVVLALATLGLATMDDTRGLGIACAIGLLIAMIFALFLLPSVLVFCGRKVFWPLVPTPTAAAPRPGIWSRIATGVTARPGLSLGVVSGILLIFSMVLGSTALGIKPSEQFRGTMESAEASQLLAEHFPVGEVYPITVLTHPHSAAQVAELAEQVPGITRVSILDIDSAGVWQRLLLAGSAEPGSAQSHEEITELRHSLSTVSGAEALVGGAGAQNLDTHEAHLGDFVKIAPLVLGICFLMLLLLTRSWVTALLLALVNLLSAAAALGLGALIGSLVFKVNPLDVQVPLLAFLFLVALGVDYTIFLTHRVQQEAASVAMRQAIVRAVSATGAVITSAGLVLAGVFAALATLPLLVLGQLGLIVGLGVLLDTFLVRTVLVPALLTVLAKRGIPRWAAHTADTAHVAMEHAEPAGVTR